MTQPSIRLLVTTHHGKLKPSLRVLVNMTANAFYSGTHSLILTAGPPLQLAHLHVQVLLPPSLVLLVLGK